MRRRRNCFFLQIIAIKITMTHLADVFNPLWVPRSAFLHLFTLTELMPWPWLFSFSLILATWGITTGVAWEVCRPCTLHTIGINLTLDTRYTYRMGLNCFPQLWVLFMYCVLRPCWKRVNLCSHSACLCENLQLNQSENQVTEWERERWQIWGVIF